MEWWKVYWTLLKSKEGIRMKQKTIIILVLIVLAFVILIQNTQVVEVQIFFWKIAMSRIIMIAFMLIVGFVVGYLVAMTKKK
jgi:uncharacterized integral membrane protein